MNAHRRWFACLVCAALALPAGLAHGETLYRDDFSGPAGPLAGTTPASRGGVGTAAWISSPNLVLSGSGSVVSTSRSSDFGAFLPFTPVSGHVYTFTLTLGADNTGGGNDNFAEFGFAKNAFNTGQFDNPAVTGYAWWLQRNVAGLGGNNYAFGGPLSTNLLFTDYLKTPTTRAIILDTTQSRWTASFVRGGTTEASFTYAIGQNPVDIAYAGMISATTSATFRDLTLTATIPELDPGPLGGMLALVTAFLGLLDRRRTRH